MQTRFMKTSKLGKEAVSSCTSMLVDTTHDGFSFQVYSKHWPALSASEHWLRLWYHYTISFGHRARNSRLPLDQCSTGSPRLLPTLSFAKRIAQAERQVKIDTSQQFLEGGALHCQPTKRQQWPHFPTPSRPCSSTGTCRTLIIINGDAAIATFTKINVLN